MPINNSLIEVLACPKCKGKLVQNADPDGFVCPTCQLLYKTEDDIPNFMIEEALPWGTTVQPQSE